MAQENQKNDPKNPQVAPTPAVASVAPATPGPVVLGLTDEQFEKLLKTIAYSGVLQGLVTNNVNITATVKNLQRVKDLGDVVVELVEAVE